MESSFAQPSPMESSSAPPHYQRSPLNHMVTIRLQQQANHFFKPKRFVCRSLGELSRTLEKRHESSLSYYD
uniref:Uncharacterized protein n=1 Tax=Helianthus annuus TaxID=4232 RepID=A0A251RN01_HELAN